jgi:hypothetical protein
VLANVNRWIPAITDIRRPFGLVGG